MIGLFLTIAFWVIVGYAFYAADDKRVPAAFAAIWLAAYGLPFALPATFTACVIIRYVLVVALALWLKIHDAL